MNISIVLRAEISFSHEDFSARSTWGSGRSPDATASQPGGADNEPLVPAPPGWVNPKVGNSDLARYRITAPTTIDHVPFGVIPMDDAAVGGRKLCSDYAVRLWSPSKIQLRSVHERCAERRVR
jgi:hypothetical protein